MRYQPYSVIHPRAIKTLVLGSLLGLSLSIASMYVPTKTALLSPLASNEFIQVHAQELSDPLWFEVQHDPIKKYIYNTFAQIDTKVARQALEVACGESGLVNKHKGTCTLNPLAKNKNSSAKGVFQIIDGTWKGYKCTGSVLIYEDNIQCAKKIYESNGDWRQWSSKPGSI